MTSSRGESRFNWLLLVLFVAASVGLVLRSRRAPRVAPPRPTLLDAVPPGPSLLVTADVEALGEAAALELLKAGGGALLGLRELCGFEPLLGVRKLALAVPIAEPGQPSDFALLAQTVLEPEPVLRCAEVVIRRRGGTPVRSALGHFVSVRDQKKPLGEIAVRDDGVFVLSGGQYFRDVIDAASGRFVPDGAARDRAQRHEAIRRRLSPAQLLVTVLDGSALPVPGVASLGAALNVGRELELRAYVACESAASCEEAGRVVEMTKAELSKEPGLASLGRAKAQQRGAELTLDARLPREQLGPLLAQLLAP